jgi:hypothetical protein
MAQTTITIFKPDGTAWRAIVNPATWTVTNYGQLSVTESNGSSSSSTILTSLPFAVEQTT